MCALITDIMTPAALREVSAAGAFVETNARPALGTKVELRHPDAGSIAAHVVAIHHDGIRLQFDRSREAVAFALVATAADMTRAR